MSGRESVAIKVGGIERGKDSRHIETAIGRKSGLQCILQKDSPLALWIAGADELHQMSSARGPATGETYASLE